MWQQSDGSLPHSTEDNRPGASLTSTAFGRHHLCRSTADHGGGTFDGPFYNMQAGGRSAVEEAGGLVHYHRQHIIIAAMGGTGFITSSAAPATTVFLSDGIGNPATGRRLAVSPLPTPYLDNNHDTADGQFSTCSDVFHCPRLLQIVRVLDC